MNDGWSSSTSDSKRMKRCYPSCLLKEVTQCQAILLGVWCVLRRDFKTNKLFVRERMAMATMVEVISSSSSVFVRSRTQVSHIQLGEDTGRFGLCIDIHIDTKCVRCRHEDFPVLDWTSWGLLRFFGKYVIFRLLMMFFETCPETGLCILFTLPPIVADVVVKMSRVRSDVLGCVSI